MFRFQVLLRAFTFFAFFSLANLVHAQVWTGNTNNDWTEPTNWSSGSVPTDGSFVTIPTTPLGGNFPIYVGPPVINYTIQNAGTITFNTFIYNNGTIINYDIGIMVNDGYFVNAGTVTFDNDGRFENNDNFDNYGTFDNAASATFENNGIFNNYILFRNFGVITNNGHFLNCGEMQSTNAFHNHSVLQNKGKFDNTIGSNFENYAGAQVTTWENTIFSVMNDLTNAGNFDNGGDVVITSGGTFANQSIFDNTGKINLSGSFVNDGTLSSNRLIVIQNAGTLENNHILENTGSIETAICGIIIQNATSNIDGVIMNEGIVYEIGGTASVTNGDQGVVYNNLISTKPPVAGCKAGVVLMLDENGQLTVQANDVDKGSYGSCGATIANRSVSPNTFGMADLGQQVVTLSIEDNNGNISTCDAIIDIIEYVPPIVAIDDPDIDATCPTDIILQTEPGANSAIATWVEPSATSIGCGGTNGCTNLVNLALNKPVFQSSTAYSGYAERAVDGNTGGVFNNGSVTHTENTCNPYWELDLESINDIDYINIWNRTDCCSDRLSDYYVLVSDIPFTGDLNTILNDPAVSAFYQAATAGSPTQVSVNRSGRYICVMLNDCNPLSLAEVEVFGCADTPTVDCSSLPDNIPGFIYMGEFDGSKYYCSDQSTHTWLAARSLAASNGGHLAVVNNAAENEFIRSGIMAADAWIGLTDEAQEGNFQWVTGEVVTYTNWYSGEPNNSNSVEHYTRLLQSSGQWTDRDEWWTAEFVMEIPCGNGNGSNDCATLNFQFDDYPGDISWEVKNAAGQSVASGGNYGAVGAGGSVSETICLPDACYDLIVYDSYGDGMCCSYGNGSYSLTAADGTVLASGGSFTYSDTNNFCLTSPPQPSGEVVITQISGPPSGSAFPQGVTTIAYSITDDCGNEEICTFDITVEPIPSEITLNCPAAISIDALPGAPTAAVSWTEPTAATSCFENGISIERTDVGPGNGDEFPVGTTFISYLITDACGGSETCVISITVNPIPASLSLLSCPSDFAATNPVSWTPPTASTTCYTGNVTIQQVQGPAPGSNFPSGVTTVAYLVADDCGNTEICFFDVTVTGGTPAGELSIICLSDIIAFAAPGEQTAVVNYDAPIASTTCTPDDIAISLVDGLASGSNFPLGITKVSFRINDQCGNIETCTFFVTVNQQTVTTVDLFCPADQIATAGVGQNSTIVNWVEPTASTTCPNGSISITQIAGPANGTAFPLGITEVRYQAMDGCGNVAFCTFNVTVDNSPCLIDATVVDVFCDDNGTPNNPDDDTFTFDLLVTGDGNPWGWTTDHVDMYDYDATVTFGPYLISDGTVSFTVHDTDNPTCQDEVIVLAPSPCSVPPLDVCADRVVSNTTLCNSGTTYGGWFRFEGLDFYYTLENGQFVELEDGTARLTGTYVNNADNTIRFAADIQFTGRTITAPADSPKPHNCLSPNTTNWYYYTTTNGTLTGENSAAGAVVNVSRVGAAFQVGVGANITESSLQLGASGWLLLEVVSQPTTSLVLTAGTPNNGNGDININLSGELTACVDIVESNCIGEAGSIEVEQLNADQWHSVNLQNNYTNPVVVAHLNTYHGGQPSMVRVRNVSSNSFEFQIDEWDYLDGSHCGETVGYVVVEAGTHTLDNGSILQAGLTTATNSFATKSYHSAFSSTPVVMSQVVSTNSSSAVVTRMKSITATNFKLRVQRQEAGTQTHPTESVAWIAMEQGIGQTGSQRFEAAATANAVKQSLYSVTFNQPFNTTPILIASMQTQDGSDAAGLRFKNLSASSTLVFVEEEQSYDSELNHTTEVAGYALFENGSICATGANNPLVSDTDDENYDETNSVEERNAETTEEPIETTLQLTDVQLYPNPARDIVRLQLTATVGQLVNVQIFDSKGAKVFATISEATASPMEINLANWQTGMYAVYVEVGAERFVKKLMVVAN